MMPRTKSQLALGGLRNRIQETEKKRQRELLELQELSRAILWIQETDERLPPMPDLVMANTVVSRKVETAAEALDLMKKGNARFLAHRDDVMSGKKGPHPLELHFGQKPHAVLVTCSDSRVPPELVFDQGLGDLFVVRLAGNAVDTLARASLIYGLVHLGAPLVVVMGHENCGAVVASLHRDEDLAEEPADVKALVQNIRSGFKSVVETETLDEQVMCGVVCNIHHTVKSLRAHPDVANICAKKNVMIVGAYYAFNGAVTFFDEQEEIGDF